MFYIKVGHLFICLLLKTVFFRSSPFIISLIYHSVIELFCSLYVLDFSLIKYTVCKYCILLHSLISYAVQALYFDIILFFASFLRFWGHILSKLLRLCQQGFYMFSFTRFIFLYVTLKILISFELIFAYYVN